MEYTVQNDVNLYEYLDIVDVADLLIKSGSNVNDLDSQNDTPLHFAADLGNSTSFTDECV